MREKHTKFMFNTVHSVPILAQAAMHAESAAQQARLQETLQEVRRLDTTSFPWAVHWGNSAVEPMQPIAGIPNEYG